MLNVLWATVGIGVLALLAVWALWASSDPQVSLRRESLRRCLFLMDIKPRRDGPGFTWGDNPPTEGAGKTTTRGEPQVCVCYRCETQPHTLHVSLWSGPIYPTAYDIGDPSSRLAEANWRSVRRPVRDMGTVDDDVTDIPEEEWAEIVKMLQRGERWSETCQRVDAVLTT